MAYCIEYSPATDQHLRALTSQRTMVFDGVEEHLADQPAVETGNRKPMRPNSIATWELRIGDLRIYYDIQEEPEQLVTILAVGIKDRNRVLIGGVEVKL